MAGKLHELLAVEPDLRADAARVLKEAAALFRDAPERLFGTFRSYFPLKEGGDDFADESTEMTSTVSDELESVARAWGRYVDAALQKEATNQDAKASLSIGNISAVLPATALLNLEGRLQELKNVYAAIPTLDPVEAWSWDKDQGCYVSAKRTSYKTAKVPRAFEASPATEQHPAQVETYTEDERVGHWESYKFSGMLTKEDKRLRLARIDMLLRAVKKARQRANDEEVAEVELAEQLVEFINGSDV
jgi:hypothetical protein